MRVTALLEPSRGIDRIAGQLRVGIRIPVLPHGALLAVTTGVVLASNMSPVMGGLPTTPSRDRIIPTGMLHLSLESGAQPTAR